MLAATPAVSASADLPSAGDASAWVTDGSVFAIAHGAGRTYIGGNFTHVGPRTGPGAPIGADGAVAGAFPEIVGGQVSAVVPDGAGGWYVGGDFTSVGGDTGAKNVAHILSDGTVDTGFKPAPNGPVRAIVVGAQAPDAGVVYLGGEFTQVHGSSRPHAAAVDGSGTVLGWNPAPDGNVDAVAETYIPQQQADVAKTIVTIPVVFLGGAFLKIGAGSAVPNSGVSPVWGVGSVDPGTATTEGKSNSGQAPVWDMGYGTTAGSFTVRALALATRNPEPPTATDAKASVAVYAGGESATPAQSLVAKQFVAPVAPKSSTGTPPTFTRDVSVHNFSSWSFAPDCSATVTPCAPTVRALALSGTTLYVGGDFAKLGASGTDAQRRLTSVGAVVDPSDAGSAPASTAPFNPAPDGPVRSIAVAGDNVYAAGDFTKLDATPRAGLAGIAAANGAPTDWDPRAAGGTGGAIAADGSTVYAGGSFTSLGARAVNRLAALDVNGALDTGFAASADDGPVQALALSPDESTLYVGGGFTHVTGSERHHIAALDPASGAVRDGWAPDLDGWALALEPVGSTLYVGGSFTHVGADERQHVAALDAASGTATSFNPGTDDTVRAIDAGCGGAVYLGGSFSQVAGADRGRVAAVTPDGALTSWDPGDLGVVYALTHSGDAVYVGGAFSLMGGAIRYGIAKLSPSTGEAAAWNPVAESPAIVRGLALSPDAATVYAAGSFIRIGGQDRGRIGAVDAATGLATPWNPSADASAYAIASSGDAVFAGGTFRQAGTAMQQGFGSWNAAGALTGVPATVSCPGDTSGSSAPPVVQAAPPPAPKKHRPVRLAIHHFKAKPSRFKVGVPSAKAPAGSKKKRHGFATGTTFVFDLTRRAKVKISIHRELFGRRKGKECVAAHAARIRRCTRYQLYGTLSPGRAAAGHHIVGFTGMFGGKRLPAGIYTAKLTARTLDGKRSVSRLTRLQVIAP